MVWTGDVFQSFDMKNCPWKYSRPRQKMIAGKMWLFVMSWSDTKVATEDNEIGKWAKSFLWLLATGEGVLWRSIEYLFAAPTESKICGNNKWRQCMKNRIFGASQYIVMHLSRQQCIWVPPHYHFFGFLLLSSFDDRAANEIKDMKYVFILLSWIDFKFLFPTGCAPLKGSKLRRLIGKRAAGKVQPTSEEFLREKTSKLRLNNELQSIFWLSIAASLSQQAYLS